MSRKQDSDGGAPGVARPRSPNQGVHDVQARLRDFADASSDWFWETGPDGEITYMSYRDEGDISGSDTSRLRLSRKAGGDPEDVARDPDRWERLWAELEAHRPFRNFEFPVRDKDGGTRYIRASGKPMFDTHGVFAGYRGVGTDVTAVVHGQRQAERLRDAINASSDAVSLFDADGRIVFTNDEFHHRFPHLPTQTGIVGMSLTSILRRHLDENFIEDPVAVSDPDAYLEMMVRLSAQAGLSEYELTCSNGRTYRCTQRRSSEGEVLAWFNDVTERKATQRQFEHYQERLRRLASEVSLAEERERHRIAAELHDGALQNLGLARIQLGSLHLRLSESKESEQTDAIRDLLDQSIRETRMLMSELSPPTLYELGLESALRWLARRVEDRHGLRCQLVAHGVCPALTHDVSVLLFQAVRELLINVVKHSGAGCASIILRHEPGTLIAEVRDDGAGFSVEVSEVRPSGSGGFGLFSLRERTELLGGSLRIESDNGGRVVISVPIELDGPAAE